LPAGRQRTVPGHRAGTDGSMPDAPPPAHRARGAGAGTGPSMADGPSPVAYRWLTYTQAVSVTQAQTGFLSLGQPIARRAVLRAAAGDRLQRTLLVHGPVGAGKGAFVDDLLALLLCGNASADQRPCNACRSCRDARARTHPDLVIGSPERWRDGRSTGESIVAAARRWLLESSGTPIAGDRRVILVESVDRANEQAQNALLKALEEPLARQMFVLVADDVGRVLPTIVSRSQQLRIGAVPRRDLVEWLVDREHLPEDQADALARIADGLPGRAIGFARQPELVEWRRRTQSELLGLLSRGVADRFASVKDLLDQAPRARAFPDPTPAEDPAPLDEGSLPLRASATSAAQRAAALAIVEAWQGLARDLLVSAAGRPALAPAVQLLPDLDAAARALQPRALADFLELLERIRDGLLQNAAPRLVLERAMLSWPTTPSARP
jgi:DNA polymerase III subunit delta'